MSRAAMCAAAALLLALAAADGHGAAGAPAPASGPQGPMAAPPSAEVFQWAGPVAASPGPTGRYMVLLTERPITGTPPGRAQRNLQYVRILSEQSRAAEALKASLPSARITRRFQLSLNAIVVETGGASPAALARLPGARDARPVGVKTIDLSGSVTQIGAPAVWATHDGSGQPVDGRGIRIAILDTGIDYTHPALGGCAGAGCRVITGYNTIANSFAFADDNGHGTHVSGIAAANGVLKGVAPGASLLAYKVCDAAGACADDDIIAGLERALDPNGDGDPSDHAEVANLSLGGPGDPDDPISQAVDQAASLGMVVVAAAGNSGSRYLTLGSPGVARGALTVGAATRDDALASFSSRGPVPTRLDDVKPDLLAPGVSISSSVPSVGLYGDPSGWAALSGTSMAAPHAAGAAALLRQLHPVWSPREVKAALMNAALDLSLPPFEQGAGRLRVDRAAAAPFLAVPGSLGFGNPRMGGFLNLPLTLTNQTTATLAITLSVAGAYLSNGTLPSPGEPLTDTSVTLSHPAVDLGPGQSAVVTATLNVASNAADGYYAGVVVAQANGHEARVPYLYALLSQVTIRMLDEDGSERFDEYASTSLFQPGDTTSRFIGAGLPTTIPVASGIYNVHAFARGYSYYAGSLYPGTFVTPLILMTQTTVAPASVAVITLRASDAAVTALDTRDPSGSPSFVQNWRAAYTGGRYTASLTVSSLELGLTAEGPLLPVRIPLRVSAPPPGVTLTLGFNGYAMSAPYARYVRDQIARGALPGADAAATAWADTLISVEDRIPSGQGVPLAIGLAGRTTVTREARFDARGATPVAVYSGARFAANESISFGNGGVLGGRIVGATRTEYAAGSATRTYFDGDLSSGRQLAEPVSGFGPARPGGMSLYPALTLSPTLDAVTVGTPLFGAGPGGLQRWGEAGWLQVRLNESPFAGLALCALRAECVERASTSLPLGGAGQYRIIVTSTHATDIGRANRVEAAFTLPASDPRPPIATSTSLGQRFTPGTNLTFSVGITGSGTPLASVMGRYSLDEGATWASLSLTGTTDGIQAVLPPLPAATVSLAYTATDLAGNILAWTINPAAQPAIPVTLTATATAWVSYNALVQTLRITGTLQGRPSTSGLVALPIVASVNRRRVGLIFPDASGNFDALLPVAPTELFDGPGEGELGLEFDAMRYGPARMSLPLRAITATTRLMLPAVAR